MTNGIVALSVPLTDINSTIIPINANKIINVIDVVFRI